MPALYQRPAWPVQFMSYDLFFQTGTAFEPALRAPASQKKRRLENVQLIRAVPIAAPVAVV